MGKIKEATITYAQHFFVKLHATMKSINTLVSEIILIQITFIYFYEASFNCNLNLEPFISEYKKFYATPI